MLVCVCVRTGIVGFVQRFAGQKSVSLWSLLRRAALALCSSECGDMQGAASRL